MKAMEKFQNELQQRQQQPMPGEALVSQGHTLVRTQTQFQTTVALQKPRDSKRDIIARVNEECALAPDKMLYAWTVKTKHGPKLVEGPSIKMAMAMLLEYGNCNINSEIIEEDENTWTFNATMIDCERNVVVNRQFRQSKNTMQGKYTDERKLDMEFQKGQSKSMRNAIINAMPNSIIENAIQATKAAIATQLTADGIQAAIERMVRAFSKWGVKSEHLSQKMEKPLMEFDKNDIATLRNIYVAIEEGHTSAPQEFDMTEDAKAEMANAMKTKAKKETTEKKKEAIEKEKVKKSKDQKKSQPEKKADPAENKSDREEKRNENPVSEPPPGFFDDIPEDI